MAKTKKRKTDEELQEEALFAPEEEGDSDSEEDEDGLPRKGKRAKLPFKPGKTEKK